MPVLRVNLMSKCYLIGCHLQTTPPVKVYACFVPRLSAESKICVFFMYVASSVRFQSAPAHDEFSGAPRVSPLDRDMKISGFERLRRTAAPGAIGICALSLIAVSNASAAEDASGWDGDARSAMRLIAGSATAGNALRAGVEIRLKSGWHTYWRYPGDAGVPPRFDFTGSQNVKAVDV